MVSSVAPTWLLEYHVYTIRDMIVSNNCPLHVLAIRWNPGTAEEKRRDTSSALHDLFATVPSVRELHIRPWLPAEDEILKAISTGSLFPRLTTLSYWPNSIEFCAEMVEKRVEPEFQQRRLLFRDIDIYSRYENAAVAARLEMVGRTYGIQCRLV